MNKLRYVLAFITAKLSVIALKLTGHPATNLPGQLALRICPDFLGRVPKPERIIAVTGTNGKTTLTNLLCDLLELTGKRTVSNRYGSNLASGIVTALLSGCSPLGRQRATVGVIEIDERSAPRVFPRMTPQLLVITNLFRDSIMRNAHPAYIADLLSRYIPASVRLLVNADDLISCRVAPQCEREYFGIGPMPGDTVECVNLINDMRICPICHGTLRYDYRRYHHIGRAVCTSCGFSSPEYDYAGSEVDFDKMTMRVSDKGGSAVYGLLNDSVFNCYNLLCAVAVMRSLGFEHERIAALAAQCRIVATRHESVKAGDVTLVMQMAKEKNALACSRAFDYVAGREGEKEIVLMMNCLGDVKHWSENVSWLYDCDFEFLNKPDIRCIVATGARALDYRLRLLLAGVAEEKIICVEDEMEAVSRLPFVKGDQVYLFYGTDSLVFAQKVRARIEALAREAAEK
ncbi:MAG: MurT ligase domain-containing protein [Oscillospiraceae bacterium]|nr:MurT ligase domain-containing protein [Oscillospiraceae bacterium]